MGGFAGIETKVRQNLKAKFPKGGAEDAVIREMRDTFLHGLSHVFQKCKALISESGTAILYKDRFAYYDHSKFDADRPNIEALALQAVNELINATGKVSKSNHFSLHFDGMSGWATNTPINRDPKRHVSPSDFSKYLLVALAEALSVLKGTHIRFVLTGSNVSSTSVKTKSLYLPLSLKMQCCSCWISTAM